MKSCEAPESLGLLTIPEAAARLRISKTKAYGLRSAIGYVQIGGGYFIKAEDLESFIEKNHHRPKSERPF